jgi:NTE family protein
VPTSVLKADPLFSLAQQAADGSAINVVHLIYKNKPYEGHYKDYEFSVDTMLEHWQSGLDDIRDSFSHRDWFDVPSRELGFVTHDVHRPAGSVPESDKQPVETELCHTYPRAAMPLSRANAAQNLHAAGES